METDDLAPLSALQHLVFCPRQCALIHLEGVWSENRETAEGRLLHARVDQAEVESRPGVRIARAVPLVSHRLGVSGFADVVEFHRDKGGSESAYPVEYKRGRRKPHDADKVQLCAQALCLEEMLSAAVPEGAIFHGLERRREVVSFDRALRARTEAAAKELQDLLRTRALPRPVKEPKCRSCSLQAICRPDQFDRRRDVARWIESALANEEGD